jgi:pSer/pThr/pTyr-binding forkhead associated (FHA) protein
VGWLLSDLGSTNGTRVNGWRVKQVRVRPGDRVQVGRVRLRITLYPSASRNPWRQLG